MLDDDGREYVDIATCARRMSITEERVRVLVRARALRAVNYGFGLLVEPAIVGGAV